MTSKITGTGSLYLKEQAAALAEVGASGQVWVDDATPNTLMFTNDAGTDEQLSGLGYQSVVQVVNVQSGASATGTTVIPDDDTIPQNDEGDEYLTLAITPKSASNILVIEITLMLDGMSTNGTTDYLLQLGDSGGIETSGYAAVATNTHDGTTPSGTAGFTLSVDVAAATLSHGFVTIKLLDASTFTWVAAGNIHQTGQALTSVAGSKSLSAELTQIRLTSVNPNTFDAGKINIHYSF